MIVNFGTAQPIGFKEKKLSKTAESSAKAAGPNDRNKALKAGTDNSIIKDGVFQVC